MCRLMAPAGQEDASDRLVPAECREDRVEATLRQLEDRLNQIEDILVLEPLRSRFDPKTALGPTEAAKLRIEADAIRKVLVQELAKCANQSSGMISATRDRWRQLRGLELAAKFSLENKLYTPNSDAIIAEAMKGLSDGTKSQEDVAALIKHAFFPNEVERVRVPKRRANWVTGIVVAASFSAAC
jgi:hypothetical protein